MEGFEDNFAIPETWPALLSPLTFNSFPCGPKCSSSFWLKNVLYALRDWIERGGRRGQREWRKGRGVGDGERSRTRLGGRKISGGSPRAVVVGERSRLPRIEGLGSTRDDKGTSIPDKSSVWGLVSQMSMTGIPKRINGISACRPSSICTVKVNISEKDSGERSQPGDKKMSMRQYMMRGTMG
jgi:hypothetical protein